MELNLDEFARVKRTVTLKGVSYDVEDMSVEAFIEAQLDAAEMDKQIEAGTPPSLSEQLRITMKLVHRAIPSLPMEVIKKLNLAQLGAISKFIRDVDVEDVEGENAEDAGEEGDKKK